MAWPRERQIEFPAIQTHHRLVTPVCLLVSVVCIAVTIILIFAVDNGPFIGPWG
jgi:hypothetical protein